MFNRARRDLLCDHPLHGLTPVKALCVADPYATILPHARQVTAQCVARNAYQQLNALEACYGLTPTPPPNPSTPAVVFDHARAEHYPQGSNGYVVPLAQVRADSCAPSLPRLHTSGLCNLNGVCLDAPLWPRRHHTPVCSCHATLHQAPIQQP